MTQVEIESIVERFKKSVPVDVVALARALDIEVMKTWQWDDSTSGAIVRDTDGRFTIWTNAKHAENRRRFTIAHEIAHFVLHRDAIGDGIQDDALYRSTLGGLLERQANRYAAALLMPSPLIKQCVEDGATTIAGLAAALRVSKTAMSIRLGVPWE